MKIQKQGLIVLVVLVAVLACGCHLEADFNLKPNGSGQGMIVLVDCPGSVETVRADYLSKGEFEVVSCERIENRIITKVKWQKFEQVKKFRSRVENGDNTVTVNLGSVYDFAGLIDGVISVKAPGKVIKTTGRYDEKTGKVIFTSGEMIITYEKPNLMAGVLILFCGGLMMICFLIAYRGRSKIIKSLKPDEEKYVCEI